MNQLYDPTRTRLIYPCPAAKLIVLPRLDNSFVDRPVERISFYIFAALNNDGKPFRWFTSREKADAFIAKNATICNPESVLIEVE